MNPIYCSTGTFVGRINGRDHTLITKYGNQIQADGFEFLMMSVWYNDLTAILQNITSFGFSFPVFHADKGIGDQISFASNDTLQTAKELMLKNCEAACMLNSEKIVVHPWGIPASDEKIDFICEHIGELLQIAQSYHLDLLLENCCCKFHSPFENLKRITSMYPELGIIIDTRPAHFHRELETITADSDFIQKFVRHIHINDYCGGYKEWEALHPILHPGKGTVDFSSFFKQLRTAGYSGSFTLEAPSMRENTVAYEEINQNLDFIRKRI